MDIARRDRDGGRQRPDRVSAADGPRHGQTHSSPGGVAVDAPATCISPTPRTIACARSCPPASPYRCRKRPGGTGQRRTLMRRWRRSTSRAAWRWIRQGTLYIADTGNHRWCASPARHDRDGGRQRLAGMGGRQRPRRGRAVECPRRHRFRSARQPVYRGHVQSPGAESIDRGIITTVAGTGAAGIHGRWRPRHGRHAEFPRRSGGGCGGR